MKHRRVVPAVAALVCLAAVAGPTEAQRDPFFFDHDAKVMFFGDSITEQYQYSTIVEYYLWTRFPLKPWHFLNAGISGQTAEGEVGRFANDVAFEDFTLCTVNYGMNDGRYRAFEQGIQDSYLDNMRKLLELCRGTGARILVLSPNACDGKVRPNLESYVEAQARYYSAMLEMAREMGFPTVDQFGPTRAALERIYADGAEVRPFPDAVHTNWPGALLMAHAILTGAKAPALISSAAVGIQGGGARLGATTRCTIANLTYADGALSFERRDEAVPMAIRSEWRPILPYVSNLDDLNVVELKATGLPAGNYALRIGEARDLATYSAADLAEGVNLALVSAGPVYDHGAEIWQAITDKNNLVHTRFRQVVMYEVDRQPGWLDPIKPDMRRLRREQLDEQLRQIHQAERRLRDLCQPRPYQVTLSPAR